jgi:ribosome-associated protein
MSAEPADTPSPQPGEPTGRKRDVMSGLNVVVPAGRPDLRPFMTILEIIRQYKAEEIQALDLRGLTVIADTFVVATVKNARQSRAIVADMRIALRKIGHPVFNIDGEDQGWWVLLDAGSIIVHLFAPDARAFYDIEEYWGDAEQIDLEKGPPVDAPVRAEPPAEDNPLESGLPAEGSEAPEGDEAEDFDEDEFHRAAGHDEDDVDDD